MNWKERLFLKIAKHTAKYKNALIYKLHFNLKWISLENPSLGDHVGKIVNAAQSDFEFYKVNSALVNLDEGVSFFNLDHRAPMLIKESTFWQPIDVDLKIGLTPKIQLPKLQVNSDVYIIPNEQNYYHWMIDVLPYVISIQKIDKYVSFLSGASLSPYQIESLNDQMVTIKLNHVWVNAANLILPRRRHETGFPTHSILKTLQEYFIYKFQPDETKKVNRIYVSRRNSTRTPENESEIEQILTSLGFQILNCSQLSLHDQFNAFHNAEIVIGPHGAGLTNLMFCQKGTKVIELIPSAFHNPCYEHLSSLSALQYKALPYDAFNSADSITRVVEESLT
jgi:hypothetical protein